jgi:hypothetical protein
MTRKQVATRLGKSLATVRRLEGVLLHPTQDSQGVHRFDRDEVEALAQNVEQGRLLIARELRHARPATPEDNWRAGCPNCGELQEQLKSLETSVEDERARHQRELAALRRDHDEEARQLVIQVNELLALMEAG